MIRVLIIDDNVTFVKAARELVLRHQSGFVVDTALDGDTAILAFHRCHYDVVVSDIRIHGVTGLEVLAECRRIRPDTSVIMITGYGDRELEQQAANSGAYAFLHKPVAAEAFCAAIDRAALHSRSRLARDEISTRRPAWYRNPAEEIPGRPEVLRAQPIAPVNDALNAKWAEEQAERIVDRFVYDEGPDDLLKLKDEIAHGLCRAYNIGERRALTHGVPYKFNIHPDIES
jgi:CheY-like chemotaxis protein